MDVGDEIEVSGRIQSREYFKKFSPDSEDGEIRVAYEISVNKLEKVD